MKAKIGGEQHITFDEAVKILTQELKYPEDKALYFVKRFDKNRDGKLSAAEFTAFRNKIEETKTKLVPKFKEYDRDGNGYITLDEASEILQRPPFNFPSARVVMLLKTFDKDHDGRLNIEEFAGFYAEAKAQHEDIAARFDELDKDGNGVLSPDEVTAIIKDTMNLDDNMARRMIQMFDENQDGTLDKTEFIALWVEMFGN